MHACIQSYISKCKLVLHGFYHSRVTYITISGPEWPTVWYRICKNMHQILHVTLLISIHIYSQPCHLAYCASLLSLYTLTLIQFSHKQKDVSSMPDVYTVFSANLDLQLQIIIYGVQSKLITQWHDTHSLNKASAMNKFI